MLPTAFFRLRARSKITEHDALRAKKQTHANVELTIKLNILALLTMSKQTNYWVLFFLMAYTMPLLRKGLTNFVFPIHEHCFAFMFKTHVNI